MTSAKPGATMATNGVDFVDEDDARRILFALFEEIANAAGSDADKHFHKVRTGDGEKRHVSFTRDSACEEGLARPRRPDEQPPLGNASAELLEFLRIFQELDNLLKLLFGFVGPGDILEGGLFLLRGEQARARFTKTQRFISSCLHLAHQEKTEPHQ